MILDRDMVEIVESGAAEGAFVRREAGGAHNVHCNPKTSAESHDRSGVLRNVGLIQCDDHIFSGLRASAKSLFSFDELSKKTSGAKYRQTLDNKGQRCN
jgi:hypothetical protein